MFWPRLGSANKGTLFPNKYQSLSKFQVFFFNGFWPKKHFTAKSRNGRFSVMSLWVILWWPRRSYQVLLTTDYVMRVPKLLHTPEKIWIWGPKTANLAQNMQFGSFWAKHWHFWPISSHARPKHNASLVPRWFFRYVGTKTFASSRKNQDFYPKTANNWHLWSFLVKYWPIWSIGCHGRPKSNANKVPRWFL